MFYELVKEAGLLDAEGGIEGSLKRMRDEDAGRAKAAVEDGEGSSGRENGNRTR